MIYASYTNEAESLVQPLVGVPEEILVDVNLGPPKPRHFKDRRAYCREIGSVPVYCESCSENTVPKRISCSPFVALALTAFGCFFVFAIIDLKERKFSNNVIRLFLVLYYVLSLSLCCWSFWKHVPYICRECKSLICCYKDNVKVKLNEKDMEKRKNDDASVYETVVFTRKCNQQVYCHKCDQNVSIRMDGGLYRILIILYQVLLFASSLDYVMKDISYLRQHRDYFMYSAYGVIALFSRLYAVKCSECESVMCVEGDKVKVECNEQGEFLKPRHFPPSCCCLC